MMDERIFCPYCGSVMKERSGYGENCSCWFRCTNEACRACSPIRTNKEAARQTAINRADPQNWVLTLEEVKAHIAESNDVPSLYAEFNCRDNEFVVHWRSGDSLSQLMKNSGYNYGKTWRCWLREPTKQERQEASWNCPT